MILPAMLVYYFIAVKLLRKKLLTGFVASLAIGGLVTFSYTAIVDAIPASSRLYISSTQDNSLLDLAFGYNGSERLLGQTTGTGGAFPGMSGSSYNKTNTTTGATSKTANGGPNGASGNAASNGSMPTKPSGTAGNPQSGNMSNGQIQGGTPKAGGQMGAGGDFNVGTAGSLRIFKSALGTMASWLLPTAIIGLFVGFFASRRRKQRWYAFNEKQQETILWAGWLIPIAAFFSIASFFHPYYLIVLAPVIAALAAIGLVEATKKVQVSDTKYNWAHYSLAVMILSTVALQTYYAWPYYPIAVVMTGLVTIGAAGWWALTPTLAHESAQIPTIGPSLLTSQQANTDISCLTNQKVLDYFEKNQGSDTYLFATTDASTAAPYIIYSGKSASGFGGGMGATSSGTLYDLTTISNF